jgi:hypothetical protein
MQMIFQRTTVKAAPAFVIAALLAAPVGAQPSGYKLGGGDVPVGGSASTEGASGEAMQLEKCSAPVGALAVAEPQEYVGKALNEVGLSSPTGLIRLMIQQSNCFVVVERGVAMQNLMQERQLAQSGMLQGGNNMGGGQMLTADYVLTPDVVFSQSDAGGVGGALGGIGGVFGVGGMIAGAIVGGVKFKQAQTSMLVADARSGVQITAASGSAEKSDFGLGFLGAGGGGFGALGGYANTAQGKVVATSFLDNYNKIVIAMRDNPALKRTATTTAQQAGNVRQAGAVFAAGDVLLPKIGGIKLYAAPNGQGKPLKTLAKSDEMVALGEEQEKFIKVQGANFEGWIDKTMLRKQ